MMSEKIVEYKFSCERPLIPKFKMQLYTVFSCIKVKINIINMLNIVFGKYLLSILLHYYIFLRTIVLLYCTVDLLFIKMYYLFILFLKLIN